MLDSLVAGDLLLPPLVSGTLKSTRIKTRFPQDPSHEPKLHSCYELSSEKAPTKVALAAQLSFIVFAHAATLTFPYTHADPHTGRGCNSLPHNRTLRKRLREPIACWTDTPRIRSLCDTRGAWCRTPRAPRISPITATTESARSTPAGTFQLSRVQRRGIRRREWKGYGRGIQWAAGNRAGYERQLSILPITITAWFERWCFPLASRRRLRVCMASFAIQATGPATSAGMDLHDVAVDAAGIYTFPILQQSNSQGIRNRSNHQHHCGNGDTG